MGAARARAVIKKTTAIREARDIFMNAPYIHAADAYVYRLLNYIIRREGRLEAKGALCDRKQGRRAIRSAESGQGINAHLFIAKVLDRWLQKCLAVSYSFPCKVYSPNQQHNHEHHNQDDKTDYLCQIECCRWRFVGFFFHAADIPESSWLVYYCRHKPNDLNSLSN